MKYTEEQKDILERPEKGSFRRQLYEVIFEADTFLGKFFDVALILTIIASVVVVMLNSVESFNTEYGELLGVLEWIFTILFTIEYLLRLYCVGKSLKYALSFFGIVDLLSVLPTYLSLLVPHTRYFAVIRCLRILRIFRVLEMSSYIGEADRLYDALKSSRKKIIVFLFAVLMIVVIIGSLLFVIEGPENGFHNIPISVYWAIVTLTTVGYGDISPETPLGQTLAAAIMILGYSIIAIPTGMVSVDIYKSYGNRKASTRTCSECSAEGHDTDAKHCKYCGAKL